MKDQSKKLIRQLGAISNMMLISSALALVTVSSASTSMVLKWSDLNMTSHVKEALSILDASDSIAMLKHDITLPWNMLESRRKDIALEKAGIVAGTEQIAQEAPSLVANATKYAASASEAKQSITQIINNITNNSVKAALTEQELVELVSASETLKNMLKGDKGEQGDPGIAVGYTSPTSSNPGSYGGVTFSSAQDFSAQTLTVTGAGSFKSLTVNSDTVVTLTSTQTLTNKTLTSPTITGGTYSGITSFGIRSTGSGAFDLTFANTENLTAARTLTITTGDAARTITLSGNPTLNDWFDQSVKTTASPSFGALTTTGDVTIGDQLKVTGVGPHWIGGAGNTNIALYIGDTGTFTGNTLTRGVGIATTLQGVANGELTGLNVSPAFIEASSGVHARIAGSRFMISDVTAGVATVTDTATVYIEGAMSATVTGANYALWVDAGVSRFDGAITLGATPATAGDLRFSNNAPIYARNAANTQNIELINLNASNQVVIGGTTGDATAGAVLLNQDAVFTGNNVIRRNTSDGTDNGYFQMGGGGAVGYDRGGGITFYGNEMSSFSTQGGVIVGLGNVSSSRFRIEANSFNTDVGVFNVLASDGSMVFTSSRVLASGGSAWVFDDTHANGNIMEIKLNGSSRIRLGVDTAVVADATISSLVTSGDFLIRANVHPNQTIRISSGGLIPNVDNVMPLGGGSFRWSTIYAANGTIQTSDARLKTSINDSDLGLDFINSLHPVSYQWVDGNNGIHYGLIAQEVKGFAPENSNFVVGTESTGWLGMNYSEYIAPLIKAVQELDAKLSLLNIGQVNSVAGNWSISEEGLLTVEKVRAKGLELIDEDTGAIYCVKVKSGNLSHIQGECGSQGTAASSQGSEESTPEGEVAGESTEQESGEQPAEEPIIEEPTQEPEPEPTPEETPSTP